ETQTLAWAGALALAAATLVAVWWLTGERRRAAPWTPALLLGLQLATLLQLQPLVATDTTAPYREPVPWSRRLGPGTAVFNELQIDPRWLADPPYRVPDGPRTVFEHLSAQDLDPVPGALHGHTYPLVPDLEGMMSPRFRPLLARLTRAPWEERARWLRVLGVQGLVLFRDPGVAALRPLDRVERYGVVTR
ncbi:MAG TPA: hypothetical protein DD490_24190, partial [Acidobacteria bacterium]|nr:hypothetical protein [Acidobacteriota bacterium]